MKTTVSVPAPEALPRDVLQKLVSDIYDAVGVRVSLTGCAGERLAETEYQNILCRAAERDPAMHARCLACTEEAARRARERVRAQKNARQGVGYADRRARVEAAHRPEARERGLIARILRFQKNS